MKKVLKWLDKNFEETIMIILLAAIVITMGIQVFMRYVRRSSLPWPEEFSRYCFIWFVFLGIGYGIRNNVHIRVDILELGIPKIKAILNIIQDIAFLGFCIYMIKPGIKVIDMLYKSGQTSPAMNISMYYVYLSLFLGIVLGVFRLLQKYILKLVNK